MKVLLAAINSQFMHANLAVRQIHLAALDAGLDTEIFEGHINLPFRDVLSRLEWRSADAIGFSCYIWNIEYVLKLCRALKRGRPGIFLFLGGPEAAYRARDLLSREEAIDAVAAGEGESCVPALLRALVGGKSLETVPGLCVRRGGEIAETAPGALLPPQRWPDVWGRLGLAGMEKRILYIETSRGCPFRCKYCLSGGAGPVRFLDTDESVRRLTHMADQGAVLIKLVDRTFNCDVKRANDIWRALIGHQKRTGHRARYHFEIGAHLLNDESFAVLADAPKGLFQFEAGIQSSDDGVLSASGRSISFAALRDRLLRVVALGTIHLHVDLIAGLPGGSMETFAKSFDDAWSIGAEQLQLGFLKLLHGSALREEAERDGVVYQPDPPYEVMRTEGFSLRDLNHLRDVETVLNWYWNSGRYPLAMRRLTEGKSPFSVLSGLAARMRGDGVFDREHGERERAQMLMKYAPGEALGDLIRFDFLLRNRRRDLPESLAFAEDDRQKRILREAFHPVRGQSLCAFGWNVKEYGAGEALERKECELAFDPQEGECALQVLEGRIRPDITRCPEGRR